MVAFQKPITDPRQRHREQHDQDEIDGAEAARPTARTAESQIRPGDRQPDQREEQHAPPRQRAGGAAIATSSRRECSSMRALRVFSRRMRI